MINYSHNDVFQTIVFIEFHLYEGMTLIFNVFFCHKERNIKIIA